MMCKGSCRQNLRCGGPGLEWARSDTHQFFTSDSVYPAKLTGWSVMGVPVLVDGLASSAVSRNADAPDLIDKTVDCLDMAT